MCSRRATHFIDGRVFCNTLSVMVRHTVTWQVHE